MTTLLAKWVGNLLELNNGKIATCPNCSGHNLDYGFMKSNRKKNVGFGAIWCDDCHHAFHVSRTEIKDNQKIVTDFPKGLIFA